MNFAQFHDISWFFLDGFPQRKRVERERESLTTSPIWTTFRDFFLRYLINFDDEDETGCTTYEYFVSEFFKYNF